MIAHDPDQPLPAPSVLVVEPYKDLRDGIVTILRRRDYVCDAVATPDAAALMLRKHDYAYVVVDMDVPEPGELVSLLPPDANLILITENVTWANDHVLRKPFSRDELLAQFVR